MLCQVLNPVLQNPIYLRVVDFLIAGHILYLKATVSHKNISVGMFLPPFSIH